MLIVSDTSPIRALHHLDHVWLLEPMYHRVLVPPAVEHELSHPPPRFQPIDLSPFHYIEIRNPIDSQRITAFRRTIDFGESEAITLAVEAGADFILLDDLAGRRVAETCGLIPVGVLGILLQARRVHLIPKIRPLIVRLRNELGFSLSDYLIDGVLQEAGEA